MVLLDVILRISNNQWNVVTITILGSIRYMYISVYYILVLVELLVQNYEFRR